MAYYFNLPMYKDLTMDQRAAIDETAPLALSGGPGTGKSVVCLWRHIRNYETGGKKSLLLTYTKTLEHYLKGAAKSYNEESSNNIDRTFWWLTHNASKFDEIIVDEGQDVSINNYRNIQKYSDNVSYGADNKQSLYEDGCTTKELESIFPKNIKYTLDLNFRNSRQILEFTRSVLINNFVPQHTIDSAGGGDGPKPILKITNGDINHELDAITSIIYDFPEETHCIGILVAGQNSVSKYHELISRRLQDPSECTKYEGYMTEFHGMGRIHVTTFKSSKGVEFDTVIIPGFDSINWMIECSDRISDKDYYVAFTRARRNLFLICKKRPIKADFTSFEIEGL